MSPRLAKGFLRATRIGSKLTEEGAKLLREEQGQDATEARLVGASVSGDPVLQRLLLALIKGQETLCATLSRLGRDVVQGTEGPDPRVLLAERLA